MEEALKLWCPTEFEQAVWLNLVKLKCNDVVRQCLIEVVFVLIQKEFLNINIKKENQEEEGKKGAKRKQKKNSHFWFDILEIIQYH